tara:strand:- start:43 stop:480 length:438 start_codon:yes stop_codon:yes gene_type:complete
VKKLLVIIVLSFLWSNTSSAGSLYGNGDIEISKKLFNYLESYLGTGIKNSSQGAKSRGRGLYLAISTTTDWGSSSYCPWSSCQDDNGISTKRTCEKRAKKSTGKKEKCKLLFKGHTIKWNGNKIKVASDDDLEALLKTAGITVKD